MLSQISTVVLLLSFYFRLKSVISMGFFNGNSLIVARRYRIQDKQIQKEKYACAIFFFFKKTNSKKSKYASTIVL